MPRSFPQSVGQGETQGWGTLPPPETRLGVQRTRNQYLRICLKMINISIELAPRPGDCQVPDFAWKGTTKGIC